MSLLRAPIEGGRGHLKNDYISCTSPDCMDKQYLVLCSTEEMKSYSSETTCDRSNFWVNYPIIPDERGPTCQILLLAGPVCGYPLLV